MSEKSGTSDDIISLPGGGGAVDGIGEKFSPDLFTGTGNFSVPIDVPEGRGEFQPELTLVYSTGNPNGPFGLGWKLDVPGVRRKTSDGVPRYIDVAQRDSAPQDTFVLSGAEDLVRVDEDDGVYRYRPRTEGLFSRIEHHKEGDDDYWEVRSKDGNVSRYGLPHEDWPDDASRDPATLADPDDPSRIAQWHLSETTDPFGNRIRYSYSRDQKTTDEGDDRRSWEQTYLEKIEYVDYGDDEEDPEFLVTVEFEYEERPDPFSSFRSGFEIRTARRCTGIKIYSSEVSETDPIREYDLTYADDGALHNGMSVLQKVQVTGHDVDDSQSLPPLEFDYSDFDPKARTFDQVGGDYAPDVPLSHPNLETVDVNGNGLPDIVEMSGHTVRYWENKGEGEFRRPRPMREGPMELSLAEDGVQFLDTAGDGRPDLMVTRPDEGLAGYFPMRFEGGWDGRSFQSYDRMPPFRFTDPRVTLMDLTGDGITDVLRTGREFQCFFNDEEPDQAWRDHKLVNRRDASVFPDVDLSDPRVHTADMTGDGLQDIVKVHSGRVAYWPNMGHGDFGPRIVMENPPSLPTHYNPDLVVVGDVDGSGCSDLIYVDNDGVRLHMNQSGNGFADPVVIKGTPTVTDQDAIRLVDLYGTGTPGLLWTRDRRHTGGPSMYFLDFTGGEKPYLLEEMDNHMGAVTRVDYEPSTTHYLRDHPDPETRWKTPLPFPTQTVTTVEVIDEISEGKLTTEYEYRHGYWDGYEREFRGFGHVIQRDTETFEDYNDEGLFPDRDFDDFEGDDEIYFQSPTEEHHWFDLGPIYDATRGWDRIDFSDEYWRLEDEEGNDQFGPELLEPWEQLNSDLGGLGLRERRDALRTLRGTTLRTELYGLDGSSREDRPFIVSETTQGIEKVDDGESGEEDLAVIFAFERASRTTEWDRGDDPATAFEFVADYDGYGQPERSWTIACPRGWDGLEDEIGDDDDPFLTVHEHNEFIHVDESDQYIVDRVSKSTTYEVEVDLEVGETLTVGELVNNVAEQTSYGVSWNLQGLQRHYYDGDPYEGMDLGELGDYGALTRTEQLVLTEEILDEAYPDGSDEPDHGIPVYLDEDDPDWSATDYPDEFQQRIDDLDGRAGYIYENEDGQDRLFRVTASNKRDVQDSDVDIPRGKLVGTKDPLGHETTIEWDEFDLLPTKVTDPVGLERTAQYDYRAFEPQQVTDPNGNRQKAGYTPLGLVKKQAVMGKEGEDNGDTLDDPGVTFEYDFEAFKDHGDPISVKTTQRVYHINDDDVPSGEDPDETIVRVEYTDGFGREIQTRIQAEDLDYGDAGLTMDSVDDAEGDLPEDDEDQRVRVSGWTRYNNKGEVIQKWEQFFSKNFDFEDESDDPPGESVQIFYDPRDREIRTVHPNGAEERLVYGVPEQLEDPEDVEPTPWEIYTYDENDNGERAELDDIDPNDFDDHWDTPSSVKLDAMGRESEMVERNGSDEDDWYVTELEYDIRDNVISVTDPLDRKATEKVYDLRDEAIRTESIDAGTSIIVHDPSGTPVESRDERGGWELTVPDELLRPTHMWGRDSEDEDLRLVQHIVYGTNSGLSAPEDENLLGNPYIHRDEAGRCEFEAYSFKGELLEKIRDVIDPDHMIDAYEDADSSDDYEVDTYRVDWDPDAGDGDDFDDREDELLDKEHEYRVSSTFDALGRAKSVTYPEDVDNERKAVKPTYNAAGNLQAIELDGDTYVEHIAYNPRGQRILAAFGNGVMTRYSYDDKTFRLQRLRSEEYDQDGDDFNLPSDSTKHQDIRYTYDAVGNVLTMEHTGDDVGISEDDYGDADEDTWGDFHDDKLLRLFEYDPLYRLTAATGRECDEKPDPPWQDKPGCTDITSVRPYREEYEYDEVGGMTELNHRYLDNGTEQNWKRTFDVETSSNRVEEMTVEGDDYSYDYDKSGNLAQENTERHYEWDHASNLRAFRNQVDGSKATVFAHYGYDSGGQRVQKVVTKDNGDHHSTVYIDGIFEHHRIHKDNGDDEQNNTLHVMDDASRIATHRVGPDIFETSKPSTQYHLGDHLDSSSVVLNSTGSFINREEYRPYGETSFGSYDRKRYRYSGKERDGESSLYYHGARYYAPWLCRWTSPDPAGMVDGVNLYEYVQGNPVKLRDPDGMESEEGEKSIEDSESIETDPTDDRPEDVAEAKKDAEDRGLFRRMRDMFKTLLRIPTALISGTIMNLWQSGRRMASGIGTMFSGDVKEGAKEFGRGLAQAVGGTLWGSLVTGVGLFAAGLTGGAKFRELAQDEVAELQKVYGDEIDYSNVEVAYDNPLLDSVGANFVFGNWIYATAGGNIGKPTLIHEAKHILQYQEGGIGTIYRAHKVQFGALIGFGTDPYDTGPVRQESRPWDRIWNLERRAELIKEAYQEGYFDRDEKPDNEYMEEILSDFRSELGK